MKRSVCFLAGLMLVVGLVTEHEAHDRIQAASDVSTGYLRVEVVDDTVTVEARDVTVKQLLEGIAGQSGLRIDLHDSLDARISMGFDRLSLVEALNRVLADEDPKVRILRILIRPLPRVFEVGNNWCGNSHRPLFSHCHMGSSQTRKAPLACT